jgi:hypothetical protein
MIRLIVFNVLLNVPLVAASDRAFAQGSRDARDAAAAARTEDFTLAPNQDTPVRQTNLFSTAPGLELQPRMSGAEPDQGQSGTVEKEPC